jgi:hypothetical protein
MELLPVCSTQLPQTDDLFSMRAPKRVLYVCLSAAKIVVRCPSHGFRHTGTFTICAVFGQFLCQSMPFIVPLNGLFLGS